MTTESARALGAIAPDELTEARLLLHYAAQPLASAGQALLPERDDHAHTSMGWDAERRRFVGPELPQGRRVFLDPLGLQLGVQGAEARDRVTLPISGRTLAELLAALGEALDAPALTLPCHDLPASPLADGAPFTPPEDGSVAELVRWFELGVDVLAAHARERLGGAPLRGWPHHFDVAALRSLDPELDPEAARSINVGLSPGDESCDEPYVYVTPYPAPDASALPELAAGRWHTEGFVAAVLTGSEVVAAGDAAEQRALVERFLTGATDAAEALLAR